jgi:hypothetical protein
MNLKKLERYLRVNLLGPGRPSSYEKGIYRAAVSQRLRNTELRDDQEERLMERGSDENQQNDKIIVISTLVGHTIYNKRLAIKHAG